MVDDDDRRVKDLIAAAKAGDASIDPDTAADLARWFGLPSYQQVEEGEVKPKPKPEDPAVVARREQMERATAGVDPVLCEALHHKWDGAETLIKFQPAELAIVDPSISAFDPVLVARAEPPEPRIIELPPDLYDDLKECTPQAVLRDLHRPPTEFQLLLEVDPALVAMMSVDASAIVREALMTRVGGSAEAMREPSPLLSAREALSVWKQAKRERWSELRTPGRRVSE
jgi:hypothetical protein